MSKAREDAATIVAKHHKSEVDAATELLSMAGQNIGYREIRSAINLLESAIEHLKSAEIIQRVLKDIGRAQ